MPTVALPFCRVIPTKPKAGDGPAQRSEPKKNYRVKWSSTR
jgi:hypothetical protein